MASITLFSLVGHDDLDVLRARSTLLGKEGDIGWYILPLPDGRWIAWDDAFPANPNFDIFDSREDALIFHHDGWRTANPELFQNVTWLTIREAAEHMAIQGPAIRKRIRQGQWPLGHARLAEVPGRLGRIWQVTDVSIQKEET